MHSLLLLGWLCTVSGHQWFRGMPLAVESRNLRELDSIRSDIPDPGKSVPWDGYSKYLKHPPEKPFIFMAIVTRADGYDRRDFIRSTVLKHGVFRNQQIVIYKFIIGVTPNLDVARIRAEMQKYDDLVMFKLKDEYDNLGEKTLSLLHYATTFYLSSFVMKLDDDVYINMNYLVSFLANIQKRDPNGIHDYYIGAMLLSNLPQRNPDEVHYISEQDWGGDVLPPFAQGSAYLLSYSLAKRVLGNQPFVLLVEDVMMGILVQKLVKEGRPVKYVIPEDWLVLVVHGAHQYPDYIPYWVEWNYSYPKPGRPANAVHPFLLAP